MPPFLAGLLSAALLAGAILLWVLIRRLRARQAVDELTSLNVMG